MKRLPGGDAVSFMSQPIGQPVTLANGGFGRIDQWTTRRMAGGEFRFGFAIGFVRQAATDQEQTTIAIATRLGQVTHRRHRLGTGGIDKLLAQGRHVAINLFAFVVGFDNRPLVLIEVVAKPCQRFG